MSKERLRASNQPPPITFVCSLKTKPVKPRPVTNRAGIIVCESISVATHGIAGFVTAGPPTVSTFATHALHGESLRLLGSVDPGSVPTSAEQTVTVEGAPTGGTFTLTFTPPGAMGETTVPIAFDAPAGGPNGVEHALSELPALNNGLDVTGPDGGPYRVVFFEGGVLGGVSQPLITANRRVWFRRVRRWLSLPFSGVVKRMIRITILNMFRRGSLKKRVVRAGSRKRC